MDKVELSISGRRWIVTYEFLTIPLRGRLENRRAYDIRSRSGLGQEQTLFQKDGAIVTQYSQFISTEVASLGFAVCRMDGSFDDGSVVLLRSCCNQLPRQMRISRPTLRAADRPVWAIFHHLLCRLPAAIYQTTTRRSAADAGRWAHSPRFLLDTGVSSTKKLPQRCYSKSTMVVKSRQKVYISHMSKPAMDKRNRYADT